MFAAGVIGLLAVAGVARADAGDLDQAFGDLGQIEVRGPSVPGAEVAAVATGGRRFYVAAFGKMGDSLANGTLLAAFDHAGEPVTDFDGDGRLVLPSHDRDVAFSATALAAGEDDRVAVLGGVRYGVRRVVLVDPQGRIDPAFGPLGRELPSGTWTAVAVMPDGGVAVGGADPSGRAVVLRLGPDGSPDPGFATSGTRVLTGPGGSATAVRADPDGRLVVAFDLDPGDWGTQRLIALAEDGSPDPGFAGGTGLVFPPTTPGSIGVIEPGPDAGYYVATRTSGLGAVAKVTAGGALSPGWGFGGVRQIDHLDDRGAMAVAPDGSVVVAVQAEGGRGLRRLTPAGELDDAFGVVYVPRASSDLSAGGRGTTPLAVGTKGPTTVFDPVAADAVIARIAGSALDGSYAPGGVRFLQLGSASRVVAAAPLVLDNGGVAVLGGVGVGNSGAAAVLRAASDGRGVVTETLPPSPELPMLRNAARLADGRLIAAGVIQTSEAERIVLARLAPDGSFDRTFGSDGLVRTDLPTDPTIEPPGVWITGHGNHVTVVTQGSGAAVLARFDQDGEPDERFGSEGRVEIPLSTDRLAAAGADGQGRLLLATTGLSRTGLLRVFPEGSQDLSFGDHGRADLAAIRWHTPLALLVEPDGSTVVAGRETAGDRGLLVRVDPDGRVGEAAAVVAKVQPLVVTDLVRDHAGRLLLAYVIETGNAVHVARLTSDLRLDPSFGVDGTTFLTSRAVGLIRWARLAIRSDGGILVAGTVSRFNDSLWLLAALEDDNITVDPGPQPDPVAPTPPPAASTPTPPVPGPSPVTVSPSRPALTAARRVTLGRLARGMRVRVSCERRCSGRVELVVTGRMARRLRLRSRVLARRAVANVQGSRVILLKPPATVRRALRRVRGTVSATLRTSLTGDVGTRLPQASRPVKIRR